MSLYRPVATLRAGEDPVHLDAASAGWDHCGLQVLRLSPDASRELHLDGVEGAVVPLSGGVRVSGPDIEYELRGRTSPFEGLTDLCYLPLGTQVQLAADAPAEIAIATAVADEVRLPQYRSEADVDVAVRGAGAASRQINGLLSADVPGPQKLIVVEVLTPEGNWSSYPPHKHDEHTDDEVPLEEIYYFRIHGEGGFAFHRTYTTDGEIDETVTVRDGDVFLVPRGYHGPCVAPPGHDLYYLNVMAGPAPERRWSICTDPTHEWIWDSWADLAADPRLPMTGPDAVR